MKPRISITFNNGVLGAVTPLDTGCFGFIASAVAVAGGFQLGTAYQVKSMRDVADLKLTDSIDNHRLFKTLSEYFTEAGNGSEAWIYGMPKTTKVSEWFTSANGIAPAENLLNSAQGKIRGLFTIYDGSATTAVNGLDGDVLTAAGKAHTLSVAYTAAKYATFFTILEGYGFTGDKVALPSLQTNHYNTVGILLGDTETRTGATASKGAAVGVLAGRLAAYPVRVNPGKVANGALAADKLFLVDTPAENYDTEALYDKGFITFTTHQNRAGYFVMDANMATDAQDDYFYLTHCRTINEACRLAYDAALDYLLDEVPTTPAGTISPIYAKNVESAAVRRISTTMGADLSKDETDPNDLGVKCFVDPAQKISVTSRFGMVLQVRPFGYNRWIDINLGFELTN